MTHKYISTLSKSTCFLKKKWGLTFLSYLITTTLCLGQMDTILIDFGGGSTSAAPWNNIENSTNGSVSSLTNSQGFSTGIALAITDDFAGTNTNGTMNPNPMINFPASATSDSFFGNTELFSGGINPTAALTLSNLDPTQEYTLELFASRVASDNRETAYLIEGATTNTYYLQVASNINTVVNASTYPDSNGDITITVSPGPNNNNAFGFFYLGGMKLIYSAQVFTPSLSLVSPVGGEFWQVGKSPEIIWESQGLVNVNIEYSINNGANWINLGTYNALPQSIPWVVPNTVSSNCLVRISSGNFTKTSTSTFEISDSQDGCHIVVLGSSTAAGAGPSSSDSTWVNRYTKAIFQQNTKYKLTNLALGGQTTFNILPNGTPIPTGFNIDPNRNLSAALTYNPSAIIINMPSNDAANGVSVQQQLENFDLLYSLANCEGVETWICTTQPRTFPAAQFQIQAAVRDSILAKYGTHALDFWTGFANENTGYILPTYDSGDGVHMNDEAHRILMDRVFEKNIHDIDCTNSTIQLETISYTFADWEIQYHGGTPFIDVEFETTSGGNLQLELFDINGESVITHAEIINGAGLHNTIWNMPFPNETVQRYRFIQITIIDDNGIKKSNFNLGCVNLDKHFYKIVVK